MDILHHGQLGQIVRCHAVVVFKHVNGNSFLIQLLVILKLKNGSVIQIHVRLGVNGGPGVVVQHNVGNLANQSQFNPDIDAGKWPTERKTVGQEKLNQDKVNYVVGQVQNYVMKQQNGIATQAENLKLF